MREIDQEVVNAAQVASADRRGLVQSLDSGCCPSCAQSKKPGNTFCAHCYYALPKPNQRALYKVMGQGYEDAVRDALIRLGVRTVHFPADEVPA